MSATASVFRLDGAIADALHGAVGVGDDQAEASPLFAAQGVGMQAGGVAAVILDGDRGRRFADDGAHRRTVAQEKARVHVLRQNVAGDADGDWAIVLGEGGFDLADVGGNEEAQTVGDALAGGKNVSEWRDSTR